MGKDFGIYPMGHVRYGVETVFPSLVKGASLKLMCVCFASSNLAFVKGRKKSDDALKNSIDSVSSVGRARDF